MTLADRMSAVNYRPSGFDYMRLSLAASVVTMHTVIVSYGQLTEIAMWHSPLRSALRLILPMFFALSGFLVAGSLERCRTIGMFLGLRVIRIFPALTVEVVMSALVLGPIFTTLPLRQYFAGHEFHVYFLNVLGDIHYNLPGVFATNPFPRRINGQLWTVPFELYCYATLTVLALLGAVKRRWITPLGGVLLTIAYLVREHFQAGGIIPMVSGPLPGVMLVVCFIFGVSLFLYREKVVYSRVGAVAALLVSAVLVGYTPYGEYVAPAVIAYLTVALGLTNPRRLTVVQGADYSYGLFLYGYPIQQTIAALGPWTHHWYLNAIGTLSIGTVVAAMSWHWVEKPASRLRHPLKAAEDWWIAHVRAPRFRQRTLDQEVQTD
jgi:peptidoglycan/LPS O-acetylase OafA/YrhL